MNLADNNSGNTSGNTSGNALIHQCSVCGVFFKRKEQLKRHQRSHTGEKPFSCPFQGCEQKFTRSDNMQKHYECHTKAGYVLKRSSNGQDRMDIHFITPLQKVKRSYTRRVENKPIKLTQLVNPTENCHQAAKRGRRKKEENTNSTSPPTPIVSNSQTFSSSALLTANANTATATTIGSISDLHSLESCPSIPEDISGSSGLEKRVHLPYPPALVSCSPSIPSLSCSSYDSQMIGSITPYSLAFLNK